MNFNQGLYDNILVTNFQILNKDNKNINEITAKNGKCYAKVLIDISYNDLSKVPDGYKAIFLDVLTDTDPIYYIGQQYAQLPDNNEFKYVQIPFELEFNSVINNIKYDKIILKFSFSTKRPNEMGISETLRIGNFFNTKVAISRSKNNG